MINKICFNENLPKLISTRQTTETIKRIKREEVNGFRGTQITQIGGKTTSIQEKWRPYPQI